MTSDTLSRSLHDAGLAAWFGGTLANAVALNPAAGEASDARSTGRVVNAGWNRWTPVNAAAIAAHLAGSVAQLAANRSRIASQAGVAEMTVVKTVLTVAALGATGYSRILGRKVNEDTSVPAASATEPAITTPDQVAKAQRQLTALQWVVPALTGALVLVSAYASEQQRATEVGKGLLRRFSR